MTPVSNERALLDRICHKEQLGVWADEIASALALSDFLKEDWTFEDSVDLSKEIAAQLRDIIGSALTHPEFNVTEALCSQSPEPSSSEVVADHIRFRRAALLRAMELDGGDFAGDLDPVEDDSVEGLARTLAIVAAAYDWTTDDKGRLAGLVGGDHGYATTGITLSPTLSQPVTDEMVERVARAICRHVPIDGSSAWNEPYGYDFDADYSDKERMIIRNIARAALSAQERG